MTSWRVGFSFLDFVACVPCFQSHLNFDLAQTNFKHITHTNAKQHLSTSSALLISCLRHSHSFSRFHTSTLLSTKMSEFTHEQLSMSGVAPTTAGDNTFQSRVPVAGDSSDTAQAKLINAKDSLVSCKVCIRTNPQLPELTANHAMSAVSRS